MDFAPQLTHSRPSSAESKSFRFLETKEKCVVYLASFSSSVAWAKRSPRTRTTTNLSGPRSNRDENGSMCRPKRRASSLSAASTDNTFDRTNCRRSTSKRAPTAAFANGRRNGSARLKTSAARRPRATTSKLKDERKREEGGQKRRWTNETDVLSVDKNGNNRSLNNIPLGNSTRGSDGDDD